MAKKYRNKPISDIPRHNDTLLIVGGAPTVWDDLEAWWEFEHPHDVCIVNFVGNVFPCDFLHSFSYHPWAIDNFTKSTRHTVGRGKGPNGFISWRLRDTGGSSSLMAVRCALRYWGYKKVVVAGVPLTNDGHWNGMNGKDKYTYTETFLGKWKEFYGELKDKLRSMSGNTRDIYGPPTKEWLNDVNNI